jgi:D-alanyl-D-alanine carboxypeptidase
MFSSMPTMMRGRARSWLLVAVVGCGGASTGRPGDGAQAADWKARVDDIAGTALRVGGAVGGSIVVMRGDETVYARGFGLSDVEGGVRATERTVYPLASISKQFWAAAIVQLVESRALDVEDPVQRWLPAFPDARVRVRHLLEHTSGLGDDQDGEDDERFTDLPETAFVPGSWWRYSNRGSLVARRVAERVSGVPWSKLLETRLARPLGLSSVRVCAADGHDAARLYAVENGKPVRRGLPPETMKRVGFLCADAIDVARWERSFETGAILRAESVARMRRRVRIDASGGGFELGYGWFTRSGDVDGHRAFGHTGNFPGVSVAAFTYPEDALTIVVLMNASPSPGFSAVALQTRIARVIFGTTAPEVKDAVVPPTVLASCAGEYQTANERLRFIARDGRLRLEVWGGDTRVWEGPLVWAGGTTFFGGPTGADPDEPGVFHIVDGRAVAVSWGHRLMLDGLARRVEP